MHQLLHDAATAFIYLGAAIMALFMLYVVIGATFFSTDRYGDD